jgi:hypothetical protein
MNIKKRRIKIKLVLKLNLLFYKKNMTNKNKIQIFFRFDDFPKESRWHTLNWKQFFSERNFKLFIMEANLLLNK